MDTGLNIKIRPMKPEDLETVFFIDKRIRETGKHITYEHISIEKIFAIDKQPTEKTKSINYEELIKVDVSTLLKYCFVADVLGYPRGFAVGNEITLSNSNEKIGEILVIAIPPNYQRQGIATKLINDLQAKYRLENIKTVKFRIIQQDKELVAFCKHFGFSIEHSTEYTKTV
jgi:ribosomal protein S18 acetylase RimI-like enzyme